MAGANRNFIKAQKERKRQEKAAAKRRTRAERKVDGVDGGSGPAVDFEARNELMEDLATEIAGES